jgi:quinol monooxygenase YgiN
MILVTGSIQARAGNIDELRTEALAHVRRSRAEPGCIGHSVAVDCEDPLTLVFFECWSDRATLETHFRAPGSVEFVAAVRRLAASSTGPTQYDVTPV